MLDQEYGICFFFENLPNGAAANRIGHVFQPIDLYAVRQNSVRLLEHRHCLGQFFGLPHDHRGQLRRSRRRAIDFIDNQAVARAIDAIENVVQARREFGDVFAVEGSDERLVQLDIDLVGHFIAATLQFLDAVYRILNLLEIEKKITLGDVVRNFHEHVEELGVSRNQSHKISEPVAPGRLQTPALALLKSGKYLIRAGGRQTVLACYT